MPRLTIIDNSTKYEIGTAQDLYDLYNDWALDGEIASVDDFETISSIREDYKIIFEKIEKKEYKLYEFEAVALKILESADTCQD